VRDALGSWADVALAIVAILALIAVAWKIVRWAVHTSDKLEQINNAVNHQPEGTPPIAAQVTELNPLIHEIAEGLAQVAAEADRKHEENQALIAGLTANQVRFNRELGTIRDALGVSAPWSPEMGDRRKP
jgi:hypothetical protein